ncbi:MAG TPA: heparan-alpha-glucosaminide N-acetyltransferase domain-containing protein [Bryobacteraceae bacterium]|nr:heparan-alpha-glucosaminide N-acetyltransferase domain-containing protein [Bryobacteraceae bacterium]
MTATLEERVAVQPAGHSSKSNRLAFLDWTRGMAATIMLQGHVFHSFLQPSLRDSGPYVISQFIGGITPAIFLFLTGVTLAFMLDGLERKGATGPEKVRQALRRAGYLAVLAIAFRLQLWLFAYPQSPWTDLLRVDILNCMALAITTLAVLAAFRTSERVHGGIMLGCFIAVVSPLISMIPQDRLPDLVRMYFRPDTNFFSYFPWAAFAAFGVGAGSILRLVTADQMHRVMQWASILGFGLIISGQYFSNLPYSLYPASDFWLNSPGLIFIKLGVILVLLAVTFLWTHHGSGQGWSWVRQLGTTSLLVYWVHIELVYGRWFGFWKESLTLGQCTAVSIALIVLMVALSYTRTHWGFPKLRFGSVAAPEPQRVSGD